MKLIRLTLSLAWLPTSSIHHTISNSFCILHVTRDIEAKNIFFSMRPMRPTNNPFTWHFPSALCAHWRRIESCNRSGTNRDQRERDRLCLYLWLARPLSLIAPQIPRVQQSISAVALIFLCAQRRNWLDIIRRVTRSNVSYFLFPIFIGKYRRKKISFSGKRGSKLYSGDYLLLSPTRRI